METLGKEFIVCPVCGNHYRKLTGGHLRTHGLDITSFRKIYGDVPTECEDHIKLKSDREKEVMSDNGFRAKRSQMAKELWQDDEIRSKRSKAIKKHHSDPAFIEGCRIHSREVWERPGYKEEKVRKMRESNKRPEVKKKRSDNMLRLWSDESFVAKVFGNQKRKDVYKLSNGEFLTLKSSYEYQTCKFLEFFGIGFSYESHRFPYTFEGKHHSYYPDFYLPEFDLYLEVKPEGLQNDTLVLAKFNSVLESGKSIVFIGESELEDGEKFLNKITTSTIIPTDVKFVNRSTARVGG